MQVNPGIPICQDNAHNNVLIILKNTLTAGEEYSFRAMGDDENVGEAKFHVKMAKKLGNFSCLIDSKLTNSTIVRGVTTIRVECDSFNYNKFAPIFYFYDVYNDEFSAGRLIASTRSKVVYLILSRENLVVEITDEYGMTTLS